MTMASGRACDNLSGVRAVLCEIPIGVRQVRLSHALPSGSANIITTSTSLSPVASDMCREHPAKLALSSGNQRGGGHDSKVPRRPGALKRRETTTPGATARNDEISPTMAIERPSKRFFVLFKRVSASSRP